MKKKPLHHEFGQPKSYKPTFYFYPLIAGHPDITDYVAFVEGMEYYNNIVLRDAGFDAMKIEEIPIDQDLLKRIKHCFDCCDEFVDICNYFKIDFKTLFAYIKAFPKPESLN